MSWEAARVQSLDSLGSGTGELLVPVHMAVGVSASVRVAVARGRRVLGYGRTQLGILGPGDTLHVCESTTGISDLKCTSDVRYPQACLLKVC